MSRTTWILLLALWLGPRPGLGQAPQDTAARIVGTVRSSIDGLPIAGVMVAVRGAQAFGVSDSAGRFTIDRLAPGRRTVRIRYADSLSYEHEITLTPGTTMMLAVLLDVSAVALSPVLVEARSVRAERTLAGFYERKQWGLGRYYTVADLDRRGAQSLQTLLDEAGVELRCGSGPCAPVSFAGRCAMSVFLDGMRVAPEFVERLRLDQLAGVEVYRHALEVPVEFLLADRSRGNCGAVVLWSRS